MFRVWVKIYKQNHMLRDTVICDERTDLNRTKLVTDALESACREFDLAVPIWLNMNITEFSSHARTRFYQDNFMEHIDFDYLDFFVIEEMNGIKRK